MNLSPAQRHRLMETALASIAYGLDHARALEVDPTGYEPRLQQNQSSFVTLHVQGQLRGCMGGLEPFQPLVKDVAEHAFMAAFSDTRFTPLSRDEYTQLHVHLSVLSPRTPITFTSEADLLAQLRIGVDGLVIALGDQRATFLPSVWQTLPDPESFMEHLKKKAGIPAHASPYEAWRYTVESIGKDLPYP